MNMNKPINLLVGGLTLFAAQGCKAPKQVAEQVEHPNIIYVFPDQYRNQALGIWSQNGFQDKVNFKGDPVHTPNLDAFAQMLTEKVTCVLINTPNNPTGVVYSADTLTRICLLYTSDAADE